MGHSCRNDKLRRRGPRQTSSQSEEFHERFILHVLVLQDQVIAQDSNVSTRATESNQTEKPVEAEDVPQTSRKRGNRMFVLLFLLLDERVLFGYRITRHCANLFGGYCVAPSYPRKDPKEDSPEIYVGFAYKTSLSTALAVTVFKCYVMCTSHVYESWILMGNSLYLVSRFKRTLFRN